MTGELAQMVERLLRMQEVLGSIPRFSILHFFQIFFNKKFKTFMHWETSTHTCVVVSRAQHPSSMVLQILVG